MDIFQLMTKNKPKYQIGDRFAVRDIVEIEIIDIVYGLEIGYIFQLANKPMFRSFLTEQELKKLSNLSQTTA
jgi:hypothetical protein